MPKGIKIKIYSQKSYKKAENTNLFFEITNHSQNTIRILKWNTPLEGLRSPCLDVKNKNKQIKYDGILVKRGAPTEKDYLILKPGQSASNRIDIREAYDVSKPGTVNVDFILEKFVYTIDDSAKRTLKTGAPAAFGKQKKIPIEKKPASFDVVKGTGTRLTLGQIHRAEENKKHAKRKTMKTMAAATGIRDCIIEHGSASRKKKTKDAHRNGYNLAKDALAALAKNNNYKTWFGKHSKTRFNKVKKNFQQVISKMESQEFTYNLSGDGCGPSDYAYTYQDTSTIWFCNAFWSAPANGVDSKAGTIVHEHTHATSLTDDIEYGQDDCKALAISKPNDAVKNAESHEYYAGG